MGIFDKKKLLFKTAPAPDLREYVGKMLLIEGKPIIITRIVPHKFFAHFYEINGRYRINMLRFHAQMLGDKSITEEQFRAFEQIQYQVKDPLEQIKTERERMNDAIHEENKKGQETLH